jgi:hypothetical protein
MARPWRVEMRVSRITKRRGRPRQAPIRAGNVLFGRLAVSHSLPAGHGGHRQLLYNQPLFFNPPPSRSATTRSGARATASHAAVNIRRCARACAATHCSLTWRRMCNSSRRRSLRQARR